MNIVNLFIFLYRLSYCCLFFFFFTRLKADFSLILFVATKLRKILIKALISNYKVIEKIKSV